MVATAVLAGVLTGCHRPAETVSMWIVEANSPSYGAVIDPVEPPGPSVSPRRIELAGAGNEVLSFKFAVRATNAPLENPSLRVSPFRSVGAFVKQPVVDVYRLHAVRIGEFPGWHVRSIPPERRNAAPLDVLVPLRAPRGGMPRSMHAGETFWFWVDITIPKGMAEGIYTTEISVASGDARVAELDVRLNVFPFTLPDQVDIPMLVELDHAGLFRHHIPSSGGQDTFDTNDWSDSPLRSRIDALLLSTLRTLQGHRLTPVLHELAPRITVDARGKLTIDWEHYDLVVEPLLDGRGFSNGVPHAVWPMPFHRVFLSRQQGGRVSSAGYTALLRDYLAQCARHFDEQGWLKRSYAMLPSSGRRADAGGSTIRVNSERATAVRRSDMWPTAPTLAAIARRADERISIVSRSWPQDMGPYGWPEYDLFAPWGGAGKPDPGTDIWLPPAQFYDRREMSAQRAGGWRTWLAIDRPPFCGSLSVYAPPGYVRVLSWQAEQLTAQVLYAGCVNAWPDAATRPTPEDCVRSDPNVLLFPGAAFGLDEPVASVRLKRLRRSMQDAAYRKLLNEGGREHLTATLRRSLAPYAGSDAYRTHFADGRPIGWVADAGLFDLARTIMADALIDARRGARSDGRWDRFARNAVWRRFMVSARRLRLYADGTRLRLVGTPTSWAATVELAVTIVNGKRVPVSGAIRLSDLPAGWTTAADGQLVGPIPPNSSRRVTLTARTTTFNALRSGFLGELGRTRSLPIELTTEDGTVHQCTGRLSCVTAARLPGRRNALGSSIRIDGDLADWPLGTTNVASDFRLIAAGLGPKRPGEPESKPHLRTTGFILRDGEYLYIAVNCESDVSTAGGSHAAGGIRPVSRRNRVDYDDLIPMRDELIEILIDPLNSGSRSPADLYHIVVKPSGTYLAEKGILFDPPCGRHGPWAANLEVATSISDERWTVELRVPLASFAAGGVASRLVGDAEHTIWGFNITRHDAARQEFSTWSGASGNAYDPLSLGNLYLP